MLGATAYIYIAHRHIYTRRNASHWSIPG